MTCKIVMDILKENCGAWIVRAQFPIGACVLLASLLVSGGCEHKPSARPDRAAVYGSVKYKGQPVLGGVVSFFSANDSTAMARCIIKVNGTYMLADAPMGATMVAIDTNSIITGAPERYVEIPEKYSSIATSGLTTTVQQGDNTADFDLQ